MGRDQKFCYVCFVEVTYENVLQRSDKSSQVLADYLPRFQHSKVLVTGAGGSIGSAICRLLKDSGIRELTALDRDENRLHSLSLSFNHSALFDTYDFVLCDIRDKTGLELVISRLKPDYVIHAAALKHLAVLEKQPREAFMTNVIGTLNVVDVCAKYKVKKFLNISTDKAASPTSVLGKSKRIGEKITMVYRANGHSGFTNVRFGNVFNSKGSVIETFMNQIENNREITITHPEVERFFMKIEEAAALSLATIMINAGDVHILEMGNQIKLVDIARRLMKIQGKELPIKFVGLRQGEKISESLFDPHTTVGVTVEPNVLYSVIEDFRYDLGILNRTIDDDLSAMNFFQQTT